VRISKLRLTGFKSFVEPAELCIEAGLTGVVGPNGCGKSNLLEAIRWVMGESSPKSMRGAGMEDVIFAGTTTRPQREFAEVTLHIDRDEPDSDGDTEAEIIRRIERGAGSAYRINGRDVRAKDVSLLFADAATGAHSPALVSQGRISAIISAKPAERRQMLEEAAGISGLHVRRKDAEQKLRAAETNLARLDDLLAEMETRITALRRQARAAERYRQLSEEIRIAEARLIFARWRDAAAAADKAKREAAAAEEAVHTSAERQRAAAAHQGEAARLLGDARAEALAAREAEAALTHRLAMLSSERTALDRRISELDARRETMAQDRLREDQLAIDATEAITRLDHDEKQLAARIAEAEGRRGSIEARVAEAAETVRQAELALAQALAAEAAQQADVRVAEAAVAAARQRLARAGAETQRIDAEIRALGDAAVHEQSKAQAIRVREAAETAIAQSNTTLGDAERRRDAAAAAREDAEARGSAARAALAALTAEIKALERANVSDARAGERLLARISAQPGYEHALAAALGDDIDAALGGDGARRWQGAATGAGDPFLPPGVEPLVKHVSAPAELERRLAQVGFVDVDDGHIALAVGQRLVTRDGKLRRWDGFVATAGGAAAAERLIRVNRLVELARLLPAAEADVKDAEDALAVANTESAAARTAIETARRALADLEQALRRANREEDAATVAIERHAAAVAGIEERRQHVAGEQAEAEADERHAASVMAALPPLDAVRGEVAQLKQAGDMARSALGDARAAVSALVQSIEHDGSRREAARSEMRNWRSRAGDAAKRIEEMNRRCAEAEAERESLTGVPERLDGQIAEVRVEAEAARIRATAALAAEREAETGLREAESQAAAAGEALAGARELRAGAVARHENQELRRIEMGRIAGERFECPAPVLPTKAGFHAESVHDALVESSRHEKLSTDRERLGPVNLVAETELRELEESRDGNQAEREELGQAINRLRGSIGSLNREGRARLLAAFEAVDQHFRRLFTTLFAGGEAHLALIDSDDPLEAGLEIMAQPPGKKLAALTLLSGGEQALTAVALIFALFLTNPAPICVLDEVDAPLDDANIERFCDLLDRMTQETDTRYLIVTHNAVTMSRMHRLFGVTMIERGVSRLVSVDLGSAERLLEAAE
jgi:chromosome segregation protein